MTVTSITRIKASRNILSSGEDGIVESADVMMSRIIIIELMCLSRKWNCLQHGQIGSDTMTMFIECLLNRFLKRVILWSDI